MINRKLTQKTENKVLLLSTCWYEALGISEIIKSLGYDVFFSDSNEKKFEFGFHCDFFKCGKTIRMGKAY